MEPEPDLYTSSDQKVPAPTGFGSATLLAWQNYCRGWGGGEAELEVDEQWGLIAQIGSNYEKSGGRKSHWTVPLNLGLIIQN